jgi:hypothetical protein
MEKKNKAQSEELIKDKNKNKNVSTRLSSESFVAKHILNYSSEIRVICLPLVFPIRF